MFFRPGHGAPTGDIRKKRFTEHQIDIGMKRSQSSFSLDEAGGYMGGGSMARFNSEFDLENAVDQVYENDYGFNGDVCRMFFPLDAQAMGHR